MKNIYIIGSLLLIGVIVGLLLMKENPIYKAVFNCSSSNASYIKSRMWLIGKTIDMIREDGGETDFVITLHGKCVPMISKLYDDIVDMEDIENTRKAQEYISKLVEKKGVKVIACQMSLKSNGIKEEDVLPFVKVSKNSFIDTIGLQNDGYGLMTFK